MKVLVSENNLTSIANAIRGKNGSTTTYKPSEMAAAITAISGAAETYWSKNKSRSKEGILAIVTTILAVLFIGLSLVLDLVVL